MTPHRAVLILLLLPFLAVIPSPAAAQAPWPAIPNEITQTEPVNYIGYEDIAGPPGVRACFPSPYCPEDFRPGWKDHLWAGACQTRDVIWSDFKHNYCWENLGWMALGIAAAAPLANTNLDLHFGGWYQRNARGAGADNFSRGAKVFGDYRLMVPIYLGVGAAGWMMQETPAGSWCGEWGQRSLRAIMAGAPAVGLLQHGLGGGRPEHDSVRWQPFTNENSVSGHAFVGAVPFLTAASMTENRLAKTAFFAGSFLTGWSRLHDDAHSVSQVMLGWWLAYLSVESVNRTEQDRRLFVAPYCGPDQVGVTVFFPF